MHRPEQAVSRSNTSGIMRSSRLALDGTSEPTFVSESTPRGTSSAVLQVTQTPYDKLSALVPEQIVEQNGYTFTQTTTVTELDSPPGVQQIVLKLSWKERTGQKTKSQTVLRSRPW